MGKFATTFLIRVQLYVLLLLTGFACSTDNDGSEVVAAKPILILNEGGMNLGNSTLAAYYPLTDTAVQVNIFRKVNGCDLGDLGNNMKVYRDNVYIIVSGSNKIEVVDYWGKSITTIAMEGRGPREIVFHEEYAYVTVFDSTVSRINVNTFSIDKTIAVGASPEGICVAGNKLYVANSGGQNYPNYGKTVSVIDIETFTELKKIEVNTNPTVVVADNYGDVYVISNGNYDAIAPALQRISVEKDSLVQTFDFVADNMVVKGNLAYLSYNDYTTYSSTVKVFNMQTEKIVNEDLLDGFTAINAIYAMDIDQKTGDLYLMDARNYAGGDVYSFTKEGVLRFKLKDVGINPCAVLIP